MNLLHREEPELNGDTRSERRLWTLPPAPAAETAPFEGAEVLDELQQTEFGLFLWQALRDAVLWSSCNAADRMELYVGDSPPESQA